MFFFSILCCTFVSFGSVVPRWDLTKIAPRIAGKRGIHAIIVRWCVPYCAMVKTCQNMFYFPTQKGHSPIYGVHIKAAPTMAGQGCWRWLIHFSHSLVICSLVFSLVFALVTDSRHLCLEMTVDVESVSPVSKVGLFLHKRGLSFRHG